jgi:hypothetical protein
MTESSHYTSRSATALVHQSVFAHGLARMLIQRANASVHQRRPITVYAAVWCNAMLGRRSWVCTVPMLLPYSELFSLNPEGSGRLDHQDVDRAPDRLRAWLKPHRIDGRAQSER